MIRKLQHVGNNDLPQDEGQSNKLDEKTISVFAKALKKVEHLKHSTLLSLKEMCCKHDWDNLRNRKLKAQLFSKMENHLDVRTIVNSH